MGEIVMPAGPPPPLEDPELRAHAGTGAARASAGEPATTAQQTPEGGRPTLGQKGLHPPTTPGAPRG